MKTRRHTEQTIVSPEPFERRSFTDAEAAVDALQRRESCGGHFRVEHQTEDGEALRHDDEFAYVAAWEYAGEGAKPVLHREPLNYKAIELKQRSYK